MKPVTGTLSDAAKLVICFVGVVMLIATLAVVALAYLKIPIPSELGAIPGIALAALVGLLGKTHPDAGDGKQAEQKP